MHLSDFVFFAITLSALFEGYQINTETVVGMFLALSGNIVMFSIFNFKKILKQVCRHA